MGALGYLLRGEADIRIGAQEKARVQGAEVGHGHRGDEGGRRVVEGRMLALSQGGPLGQAPFPGEEGNIRPVVRFVGGFAQGNTKTVRGCQQGVGYDQEQQGAAGTGHGSTSRVPRVTRGSAGSTPR